MALTEMVVFWEILGLEVFDVLLKLVTRGREQFYV